MSRWLRPGTRSATGRVQFARHPYRRTPVRRKRRHGDLECALEGHTVPPHDGFGRTARIDTPDGVQHRRIAQRERERMADPQGREYAESGCVCSQRMTAVSSTRP